MWPKAGSIPTEDRTRTRRIQSLILTSTPKCCKRSDVTEVAGCLGMTSLTYSRQQF